MDNYVRVKKIGEGSFGKALLVKRKLDNKQCVIKEIGISRMSSKEKEDSRKEVKVLSQLKHPNIVSYLESFESTGNLYIVMDYCEGGDLYQMIVNQRGLNISENKVLDIFVQCCLAVKHIHDRKILHRDIKTQNIFLTKHHMVKIGDFGIARVLKNTMELARTCIGTPYYLSPEIVENRPYNNKSDIWSLGCVLYELATLKHAFEAGNMKALVMKIVRGSYPPLPNKYTYELRALVAHCFKRTPSERPSITTLLRKPIIQQRISKFLSPEKLEEEFSHTILHKQKYNAANPVSRPVSSVSNKPISKRPISGAKKAMDPALIYGVSVSKKATPIRKPLSGLNKDQKMLNKPQNNYKKAQDARERRRKDIISQEKQYQDYMKNLQDQRFQKQQQAHMNRAREAGWKNVLTNDENYQDKVKSKDEIKTQLEEAKKITTPADEKPQDDNNGKRNNMPKMNPSKAINSSDKSRILDEFWQRKNAAAANKARGFQEVNGNPQHHDINQHNPLLQFHDKEMEKQGKNGKALFNHAAARNKQELDYLKQLEEIRKQNYKERKAVKVVHNQPGQLYLPKSKPGDPRFDPEARRVKIEALKAQAEQRSIMLREQLDLRRKHVVARLERERFERMRKNREQKLAADKDIPVQVDKPDIKVSIATPSVGLNTAMNQLVAPKLFRSCSEGDLQNVMKEIRPVRKNWNQGLPKAPFEFANIPMEITSSAMEATVLKETVRMETPTDIDNPISRKHWGKEGKTQLISMLHKIDLSGTKMPTMEVQSTLENQEYNVKNKEDEISETVVIKRATPNSTTNISSVVPQVNQTITLSRKCNPVDASVGNHPNKELGGVRNDNVCDDEGGNDDGSRVEGCNDDLVEEIFLLESKTNSKTIVKYNKTNETTPSDNPEKSKSAWDVEPVAGDIDNDKQVDDESVEMNLEDEISVDESFHTPARSFGLQTGGYDSEKKLLRTCSLPDLRSNDVSPSPSVDSSIEEDKENREAKVDEDIQVEDFDEDEEMEDVTIDNKDVLEEADDDGVKEEEEEEFEDYESMLESMRGVLNSSAHSPNSTLLTNEETLKNNVEADDEWGSDEEEKEDGENDFIEKEEKTLKKARDVKLKDTLFSRIEESRKMLEDELGFDLFVKVYKHVQMIQDNEEEDNALEIGAVEINDLLGDKDYLYQKVLYLVMADTAYCEGNDGEDS